MQPYSPPKPSNKSAYVLFGIGLIFLPAIYQLVSFWQRNDQSGLSATIGIIMFSLPSLISIVCLLASAGKFISTHHKRRFINSIQGSLNDTPDEQVPARVDVAIKRKLRHDYIASYILLMLLSLVAIGLLGLILSQVLRFPDMSPIESIFAAILGLLLLGLTLGIVMTVRSIRILRKQLSKKISSLNDIR